MSFLKGNKGNRRSFLKLSALLTLTTVSSALIPDSSAEAFLFGRKEKKISKTRLVMGTYVTITVIHSSEDQAAEAIELAFAEIDRLNAILSRHLSTTPIAFLNKTGKISDAPPELIEVLERSSHFHRESGGAFDVTVLPLLELYENGFSQGSIPADSDITERLDLVGAENISVKDRTISFNRSGMGVTTDGIAKGYIVDRASLILTKSGIGNHLINAGGDIRTHGHSKGRKPWKIAVEDPEKGGEYPEIIRLNNGAVATSGNYEIYFDEAKLFHHIINPDSGRSPLLSKSVSVTAPTVLAADALSTAVFVLEPEKGVKFINGKRGCGCFIVDRDDNSHRSGQWPVISK